ncbi:MAG: vancomycin resistance protein YoaR [Verrucomicrobiales bacterium]
MKPKIVARLVGLVLFSLILGACGLFGDDDEAASPDAPVDVLPASLRVEWGDRFFTIDPSSITLGPAGEPTNASLGLLTSNVANLTVNPIDPTNAGIEHDGAKFVVIGSVPGQEPDLVSLARRLANVNPGMISIELPFSPVPADVTNALAQLYADELNGRLGDGLDVTIGGEKKLLAASTLGPATTVSWRGDWEVSIDFSQIESALSNLFPDVGAKGGEASFTVEPGPTNDDPSTVVIVPGPARTTCCDEASTRRLEQALTSDIEVVALRFRDVDPARGEEWAESLGITELVGTFSTRYTARQDRVINIRKIAELTKGYIIEPGGTFSLNEHVGQRTREKGFVPAGTIINGHLVDSVGGGISQFATTIFNASFFAGLEYERYQSHSIYFSRYPYGREATISWPAPELEIHNPTPHGILIWSTSTENSVTVDLYSTKWADVEQTGQREHGVGAACTRVTTERTRTYLDGTTEIDTVFATYRQEGIACDGTETQNPDEPPPTTTTTTLPGDGSTTTTTMPVSPTTIDSSTSTTTTSTTTTSSTSTSTTTSSSTTTP